MKCPLPSQGPCINPAAVTGDQNDEYPLGTIAVDSKRIYWVSNDLTQIFVLAK